MTAHKEKAPDFTSIEVSQITLPGSELPKTQAVFNDPMLTGYSAVIVNDSVPPSYEEDGEDNQRLTTMVVRFPRCVLAEFNTHRVFCLAGDSELEFDLPTTNKGNARVYRMTIAEFVEKWHNGAALRDSNPKRSLDTFWMEEGAVYSAKEISDKCDYSKAAIHVAARNGKLAASRGEDGRSWMVSTEDFLEWRSKEEKNRQPIEYRMSEMKIRQVDENTGKIVNSTVKDCVVSGEKEVYEVRAGEFTVAGSKDHLIYTSNGYVRIEDIVPGETEVITRAFGKAEDEHNDPDAHRKIDGQWRSVWQRKILPVLVDRDGGCVDCGTQENLHVHHVLSVHERPDLAFEVDNVEPVCSDHHKSRHSKQGWQGGTYLYGKPVVVDSVNYRGVEKTYDLEIAGEFPNFVADGVVVHNSRNSASSRARSMSVTVRELMEDPYIPLFTRNQRGMSGKYSTEAESNVATREWLLGRDAAVASLFRLLLADVNDENGESVDDITADTIRDTYPQLLERYAKEYKDEDTSVISIHKQNANRIIEPFMWHEVIVSATDWENYFWLRDHADAQPEIKAIARLMMDAMEASTPMRTWLHTPFEDEAYSHANAENLQLDFSGVSTLDMLLERFGDVFMSSAGDCARVSYSSKITQGSTDSTKLGYRLLEAGHLSPFEHVAVPVELMGFDGRLGVFPADDNFSGHWVQFRTLLNMKAEQDAKRTGAEATDIES